jgi:hypothetical protein
VVIGTDCIGSCKSNYHTITGTTTKKADRHDKTEILLKVALNTTKQTNSEMSHIWKEYLTWLNYVQWFSRRISKCKKLTDGRRTDDERNVMAKVHSDI